MLKFICQLANEYEREHGFRPNLLYIKENHFNQLRRSFSDPDNIDTVVEWLDMDIVITQEAIYPHMGWEQRAQPEANRLAPGLIN